MAGGRWESARREQRYRPTVAVADQHRAIHARRGQCPWQEALGFVQVAEAARPVERLGLAMPPAVVDQAREPEPLAQAGREVPPQRHRAQALVQEHERRASGGSVRLQMLQGQSVPGWPPLIIVRLRCTVARPPLRPKGMSRGRGRES